MKQYTIYLRLTIDCDDKAKKPIVDKARVKAQEVAIQQFKVAIKDLIKDKSIKLAKEQPNNAVIIDIDESKLEKVIQCLTAMEIVSIIEAPYGGPPIQDEKPKSMKRFMK